MGGGNGDVRRGCSSVGSSSTDMLFIVGQVPAITSQKKHIESRNSREYSKKEKAKSTGVSGRALKK